MFRFILPLLLIPTASLADPVTVAVSAITTVASASLAAGALAWSWGYFAATVALSLVSKALAPDLDDVANNLGGYDLSGTSAAADHAIIYGRTKVSGPIIYKETTDNNKYLHIVVALAGHEIENVEEVYLNDERLSFGSPTNYDPSASYLQSSVKPVRSRFDICAPIAPGRA